jgi:ferritin-like metal-binding protein YciE
MATDTETTERLVADRSLVAQYLGEAHAMEAALVTTLSAHLSITPPGSYRDLLERHLDETRSHAAAIERRLAAYDGGTSLIGAAVGLVETVVGQALTLAKGPIDMLRGTSLPEKLLKNAKDESATEALEITTYDAIEAVARAIGDDETAELAQRHRADEERMLAALRREIPELAGGSLVEREAPVARSNGNGSLPIPGYDTLNAGQVIRRLPRLSPAELRRVADYERSHRNRSGVLNRIEALRKI